MLHRCNSFWCFRCGGRDSSSPEDSPGPTPASPIVPPEPEVISYLPDPTKKLGEPISSSWEDVFPSSQGSSGPSGPQTNTSGSQKRKSESQQVKRPGPNNPFLESLFHFSESSSGSSSGSQRVASGSQQEASRPEQVEKWSEQLTLRAKKSEPIIVPVPDDVPAPIDVPGPTNEPSPINVPAPIDVPVPDDVPVSDDLPVHDEVAIPTEVSTPINVPEFGARPPVERDAPMTPAELQSRGSALVRWIEDPNEPGCPIPPHSLTFHELDYGFVVDVDGSMPLPADLQETPIILGFALDEPPCRGFDVDLGTGFWVGMTAPGMIIMQNISRRILPRTAGPPHCNEVALALYTRDHPIDSLQYVYVTGIMNRQTRAYLEDYLYAEFWPGEERQVWRRNTTEERFLLRPRYWERGSEEFEELLGTRIGRTVAYLVLAAFPRGTRRIARICTYGVRIINYHFEFRFDIEPIP